MTDLISIIVTTWNREDALDAVLRSLGAQSDRDFEVIVADDGSGPSTAKLIAEWQGRLGRPLKHVWQEHRGFRAAEIRNRAILASEGTYCIFLDGDCIARPGFIATHRKLAEQDWFVTGNRILMSEQLTATVLRDKLDPEFWNYREWARERGRGGINRTVPLMRLPLGPLRKLRWRAWRGARSCNLAVWRRDLDRIDGFDCAYEGWGREDSDLLVRLLHAGVRRKDGVFATGVLHLWHPSADRSWLPDNDRKLEDVISDGRIKAQRGLSAMREETLQTSPA
ncbi:MAG: glycosyltransferase family 2 protein [Pseudorhodoplanes sp.]